MLLPTKNDEYGEHAIILGHNAIMNNHISLVWMNEWSLLEWIAEFNWSLYYDEQSYFIGHNTTITNHISLGISLQWTPTCHSVAALWK